MILELKETRTRTKTRMQQDANKNATRHKQEHNKTQTRTQQDTDKNATRHKQERKYQNIHKIPKVLLLKTKPIHIVYLNKKIEIDMGLQISLGQNDNKKNRNIKITYLAWAFSNN